MNKIWKRVLPGWLKLRIFRAAVESILLYGCGTWSLTKSDEKMMDGCYTRMLRKIYKLNSLAKVSNNVLYTKALIKSPTPSESGAWNWLATFLEISHRQHTTLSHGIQDTVKSAEGDLPTTSLPPCWGTQVSIPPLNLRRAWRIDMSGVNCSSAPSQLARIDHK